MNSTTTNLAPPNPARYLAGPVAPPHITYLLSSTRGLKLNIPIFEGDDPTDCLFQIEAFFYFHGALEEARM